MTRVVLVTFKVVNWKLERSGMNPTAESYLMVHRFGSVGAKSSHILLKIFHSYHVIVALLSHSSIKLPIKTRCCRWRKTTKRNWRTTLTLRTSRSSSRPSSSKPSGHLQLYYMIAFSFFEINRIKIIVFLFFYRRTDISSSVKNIK